MFPPAGPALLILLSLFHIAQATQIAAASAAAQFGLATSTTLPFPTSTQSSTDAQNLLVSQWGLNKARIQDGPENIAFVADPFPDKPAGGVSVSNTSGPVMQITYPEGSFSHDTGGVQFYSLWNTTDGSSFNSMMVSYEIAFDAGFDWVKGGKLPGLRGGLNSTGCSGGNKADGLDCFSSRLMWRKAGAGEIYAYIPTPNNLCSESSIICNSDFGISIDRGTFTFTSGQWMRITQLVQLNNPPDVANGHITLYFNDVLAAQQTGLQIRASDSVVANGFYFSTFFGGSDTSWATPVTTHTFFRNVQLWGSSSPSNLTGSLVNNAPPTHRSSLTLGLSLLIVVLATFVWV
ncbi:polysaccharide lyase family 14 protein [Hypholoma sublateritium FD-334 SS-4]|uniref:Polysaccharide lyase family 14 protein n=1 Tax=Hypholoma sublateritium (strain FD-334 SS-4) TaxID=945553 RepID=A0A0D2NLX9_HYPSF|nr:polysaccharide lyase family 14 protein [Hypholoma sublateritium FD-334 SS-4]